MRGGFQISNFKFQISSLKLPLRSFVIQIAVGLTTLVSSNAVFAQSCPACYANAAAQTSGMLQALKTGILVMMLPSLSMFIVIFTVAYRRRESFSEASGGETKFKQDLTPDQILNWHSLSRDFDKVRKEN